MKLCNRKFPGVDQVKIIFCDDFCWTLRFWCWTLRCQIGSDKLTFIDEISMVGNTTFNIQINNRLKDIAGSSLPFGGISISAFGDSFQLQPVMDGYIFKDMDNDEYGILDPNIWQELFKMFGLNIRHYHQTNGSIQAQN